MWFLRLKILDRVRPQSSRPGSWRLHFFVVYSPVNGVSLAEELMQRYEGHIIGFSGSDRSERERLALYRFDPGFEIRGVGGEARNGIILRMRTQPLRFREEHFTGKALGA